MQFIFLNSALKWERERLVEVGRSEADDAAMMLTVDIWRGAEDGHFQRFQAPRRDNQTVLDVVTWVQRYREPGLAYRFACRVGMCGSCAMAVNGRPRWTCRTHVSKVSRHGALTIAPLRNLPKIKDLVTDMTGFFEKGQRAGGRFRGAATRSVRLSVNLSQPATTSRARWTKRRPSWFSRGGRVLRSKSVTPNSSSRVLICRLTPDGDKPTVLPAAAKLRWSTMASSV